ncbi:MAG: hypothetical protein E6K49_07500 [Gammaproteobacteria bacterium]|nr:MAG: hypothetical protein E6K49_07500 [Gammaproteobacteria bacterium]
MTRASEISATAAAWLIRADGEPSWEQWQALEEWLDADARHNAEFIRLRAAWICGDPLKLLRPADGRVDPDLLAKVELEPPGPDWGSVLARLAAAIAQRSGWVAGAAALVVSVGLLGWLGAARIGWRAYQTDAGRREQIALPDGSSIQLNADSRLRVRVTTLRRDVELTRGEALFNVAIDRLRPFHVNAGDTVVRAGGTAFSVRVHDDRRVEVLVAEGSVTVGTPDRMPSGPAVSARESAIVEAGAVSIKRLPPASVCRKLAWTGGRIVFGGAADGCDPRTQSL